MTATGEGKAASVMKRKWLLIICGLATLVWLVSFGFDYYTLNQGCLFPALSFDHGGYICTDPPRAKTSPIPAEDLAVLTMTPAEIIELAATRAAVNTVMLAIYAGLAGAAAFGATKIFRKLRGRG